MKGYCVMQRISGVCGTNLTVPLSPEYLDGCKEDVRAQDCVNKLSLFLSCIGRSCNKYVCACGPCKDLLEVS